MENTTATDTTYLEAIAAAVTPDWVSGLDGSDLLRSMSDAPGSGLHVELHRGTLRQVPAHELTYGSHAVVWICDDGRFVIWAGIDPTDETGADGAWVYGADPVIDPTVLADAVEELVW